MEQRNRITMPSNKGNNRHKNGGQNRPHRSNGNSNKKTPNPGSHDSMLAKWKKEGVEISLLLNNDSIITGKMFGFDAYSVTLIAEGIGEPVPVFKHSIDMMMTKTAFEKFQELA